MITLHYACLASHTVALSDQKNLVKQLSLICIVSLSWSVDQSVILGQFKVILERSQPGSFKDGKYALLGIAAA